MRELRHVVAPEEAGRRLGSLLRGAMGLSRHRVSSLKFSGGIRLDGEAAHTDARVRAGQVICVRLVDPPAALSPAEVIGVNVNEEEHTCHVTVPADQLSLAIGKEGQNARLAAKLTGFKIDIKPKSEAN